MINVIIFFLIFSGIGLIFLQTVERSFNNWPRVVGESFFVGIFIILGINNVVQFWHGDLNQSLFFIVSSIIAVVSILFYLYRSKKKILLAAKEVQVNGFNMFHLFLLLLMIIHLYYMTSQNTLLPLTPWDAWSTWVAKAKIWFAFGIDQLIVNQDKWLKFSGMMTNKASHYPDGLSLLYVFNSGFLGWNEIGLNAIYPAMYIAFLLAFYGNLKALISHQFALYSVFVLASIPFVNIHIVLAGYADLWIAAFLIILITNLQLYINERSKYSLFLALIFSLSMVMFKLESFVWLLIVYIVFGISIANQRKRKFIYVFLVMVLILWYFIGGFKFSFLNAEFIISPDVIAIPGLGKLNITFVDTTSAWVEALFVSQNWHLLWYSIPIVAYMMRLVYKRKELYFTGFFLLFSAMFLFVLFNMTYASKFATSFTSINRLVLHIVPVYIYFVAQVIYQYQKQKHIEGSN